MKGVTATTIKVKSQFSQNMMPSMPRMVNRSTMMLKRRRRCKTLDGLDVSGDRAQESSGLMAIEIAQREALQMVIGPHAEIVGDPLSHALGVVVRDVGSERPHQGDDHHHDRGRRCDLHLAAAGQNWFQDIVEPRGKLVAADNIVQNDFERPGRGQAHQRLHQHGKQNEEEVGPVRPNKGAEQGDQREDSRICLSSPVKPVPMALPVTREHFTRTQEILSGAPPFVF